MANVATDRLGGVFRVGAAGAGVHPLPRLVVPDEPPAGPVAGVHGSPGAALARDVAAGVLVLGSAAALWIGFFAATW